MRKLVDAPRKKKQWTEKEEAYLQDKWGTVSIKGLSKALGRSENAIIVRAQRLGCGAHLAGDTRIFKALKVAVINYESTWRDGSSEPRYYSEFVTTTKKRTDTEPSWR